MEEHQYGFTHDGMFHADDVFATALLTMVFPGIKILRGSRVPENFEGIVYDIGMGEFDHHQKDARVRGDGTPYGAFGLLWERYGAGLLGQEAAEHVEGRFVKPLDAADNGKGPDAMAAFIASFNEPGAAQSDERFFQAVETAKGLLSLYIENTRSRMEAERQAKEGAENLGKSPGSIEVLETYIPWKEALIGTEKNFCIYPSLRNGWNAQGVPCSRESPAVKIPFPEEWAGADPKALGRIDPGLLFCHKGRHLINTRDKETAIRLCRIAQTRFREGEVI